MARLKMTSCLGWWKSPHTHHPEQKAIRCHCLTPSPMSRAPDTRHEVPNISRLLEMLGRLTDPRSPQGKRHELVFTLACAVVAVPAGACNYVN